jgi:hypothetical protein
MRLCVRWLHSQSSAAVNTHTHTHTHTHTAPDNQSWSQVNRTAAAEALGLDVHRLDATWAAMRREGSFQWVNADPELSAFMPLTHVNSSGLLDPPVTTAGPAGSKGWLPLVN